MGFSAHVDVSRHAHELVMGGRDAPFQFCRFAKTAYSILRNEFACHVTGQDFRHCTPFPFLMCDFVESRVRVHLGGEKFRILQVLEIQRLRARRVVEGSTMVYSGEMNWEQVAAMIRQVS